MEIIGLGLPTVKPGDDLASMILDASEKIGGLLRGDVVVVSSKAVATAQGRMRDLSGIRPSTRARRMASVSGQPPEFVELVLREADRVLNVVDGAILTLKDGLLCANAGADLSNAPTGKAVLMPSKSDKAAEDIRKRLSKKTDGKIGVVVSDSVVRPLRLGTVAQAVGVAGIEPVADCRGKRDIYGKPLRVTFRAVADQLATAAQLVMGEAGEGVPVAVVRGASVEFKASGRSPKIPPSRCIYGISSPDLLKSRK